MSGELSKFHCQSLIAQLVVARPETLHFADEALRKNSTVCKTALILLCQAESKQNLIGHRTFLLI